ncbi:hypothetical protein [Streptomyces sp. ODS28]|uniref:hypothetical protein n=1 Tax=Streptomyces sp. ODS28 TaxID=3136688 RepID=UPI0031E748E3
MNTIARPFPDGDSADGGVATTAAWEMALRALVEVPAVTGVPREFYVRRMTRWQAEAHRELMADMYVAACPAPGGTHFENRGAFLARLYRDLQQPGFDLVVADGISALGYGYGFRLRRDGTWWNGYAGELPPLLGQLTACGRVFALGELVVLPQNRRGRIATRIVESLLARSGALLATALVAPDNAAAQAACAAWGWKPIGRLLPAGEKTPLDVLVHPVLPRVHTAGHLSWTTGRPDWSSAA